MSDAKHRVPKHNGVAQAALGRKPTAMKHRNAPRGGARNAEADILATLAEELECPEGCDHTGEDCAIAYPGDVDPFDLDLDWEDDYEW